MNKYCVLLPGVSGIEKVLIEADDFEYHTDKNYVKFIRVGPGNIAYFFTDNILGFFLIGEDNGENEEAPDDKNVLVDAEITTATPGPVCKDCFHFYTLPDGSHFCKLFGEEKNAYNHCRCFVRKVKPVW